LSSSSSGLNMPSLEDVEKKSKNDIHIKICIFSLLLKNKKKEEYIINNNNNKNIIINNDETAFEQQVKERMQFLEQEYKNNEKCQKFIDDAYLELKKSIKKRKKTTIRTIHFVP